MAVEIKVPPVGESVTEGVLARWLKRDGEFVRRDEPVFELESDKATSEVPSPEEGILQITVPEGQTVPIGSSVGRIVAGTAPATAAPSSPAVASAAHFPRAADEPPGPKSTAILSPAAELLARSKGIDPNQLSGTGSGRGGRFIKEDIVAVPAAPADGAPAAATPVANAETPAAKPAPVPAAPPLLEHRETRQRMSPLRARIASRLLESQNTTASLTTFNEADMTAVNELRAKFKDKFKEKHGVGLGYSSFFVKAVVEGLKAFPVVNARIEGDEIVTPNYFNIGVAVSTEKGLMVPVLRDAHYLSFAAIEKGIAALAVKARDGKIAVSDLQGGTFTITNGGIFGSLLSTPILNPPQTGILGMHAIQRRPVAVGDRVEIRPMMYLALTYDHRLIDGREAVQFLVRVKECIEDPHRIMLDI